MFFCLDVSFFDLESLFCLGVFFDLETIFGFDFGVFLGSKEFFFKGFQDSRKKHMTDFY